MGRKKSDGEYFPEMNEILEGMQELLCDEDGKPLPPDHPHYKKVTGFMENIADRIQRKDQGTPPSSGPQGTA